jgi:hypothetical protein
VSFPLGIGLRFAPVNFLWMPDKACWEVPNSQSLNIFMTRNTLIITKANGEQRITIDGWMSCSEITQEIKPEIHPTINQYQATSGRNKNKIKCKNGDSPQIRLERMRIFLPKGAKNILGRSVSSAAS